MTHAEYNELLAAAALDALDAAETRALAAHVATCAECRAELAELRAAAAALACASAPVAPDPQIRTRLLAQLKATPQTTQAGGAAVTAAQNGAPALGTTGTDVPAAANVLPFAQPVRRGLFGARPLAVLGALAASIIIAALVVALVLQREQNRRLQSELTRVAQNLHETQATLAAVRADRELLAAPDAHTAELASTGVAAQAHARLTYDENTGRAVLSAAGLPAPPPGRAYQLWFIANGKPLPGGVFITDAAGHAELHEQIPPAGRHAQIFAVTLEPQTGAQTPTMPIYLKSSLTPLAFKSQS